jgi:hypothetical protein
MGLVGMDIDPSQTQHRDFRHRAYHDCDGVCRFALFEHAPSPTLPLAGEGDAYITLSIHPF